MITHIVSLMQCKVHVGIVTAAGYPGEAHKVVCKAPCMCCTGGCCVLRAGWPPWKTKGAELPVAPCRCAVRGSLSWAAGFLPFAATAT